MHTRPLLHKISMQLKLTYRCESVEDPTETNQSFKRETVPAHRTFGDSNAFVNYMVSGNLRAPLSSMG